MTKRGNFLAKSSMYADNLLRHVSITRILLPVYFPSNWESATTLNKLKANGKTGLTRDRGMRVWVEAMLQLDCASVIIPSEDHAERVSKYKDSWEGVELPADKSSMTTFEKTESSYSCNSFGL